MKISLNWLKDYVNYGVSTEKLAHRLTMAGLEVEVIESVKGDTVFELEVTPNRADCLNMIGTAREVSAILNKSLKTPKIKGVSTPKVKCDIRIEDTKDCGQYIGTVIEGIKVGKAPDWIKKRIEPLGLRPISNIVDVTNFVLMEGGQPLHAFDYDKLEGGKIIVRRAKKGEKIVALDDQEYKLDPSILVIADAKKPVAIAGIMGGKSTEVTASTKNILLESAYFDPILTRRASRKLGLTSDSCYRFERGVDFEGVLRSSNRAIEFILDLAGGKVTKYAIAGTTNPKKNKPITISKDGINHYLGTDFSLAKIKSIFNALDFKVSTSKKDALVVTAPTFRSDIKEEVDLIEEIARIVGYDELPSTMPKVPLSQIPADQNREKSKRIKELMLAQGFDEIVTFSLLGEEDLKRTKMDTAKTLRITNPLSLDQEILQPSVLPGLLSTTRTNINRGQKNLKLFEVSKVYSSAVREQEVLSILMCGTRFRDWRINKKESFDLFDLKGAVQQVCDRITTGQLNLQIKEQPFLEGLQSMVVSLGQKEIGWMGKVDENVLNQWDIKEPNVYVAQIAINKINTEIKEKYKPVSEYPAIVRDISLAVKKEISFGDIQNTVLNNSSELLKEIQFSEQYLGDKIPAGQRGLVFSLIYQSKQRTLREEEVNTVHERIEKALVEELGATRR